MKNNIVLVSDDENLAKEVASKLLFLRKHDDIEVINYTKALTIQDFTSFDTVLAHEASSKERTVDLVRYLRKHSASNILLLINSNDSNFVLECYENGIDDFCFFDSDSEELVVRIVKLLKQNSSKLAHLRDKKLLEQLKVIDEYSKLYSYSYSKLVIENIIDYEMLRSGAFLAISFMSLDNLNSNFDRLVELIKISVRSGDIVTLGKDKNIYLFLPYVNLNGAISVFRKIQENLDESCRICAGITELGKNFVQMEIEALQALAQAISTETQYVIYEKNEVSLDDWLIDQESKNYKLFRQIYNKKLQNVITPVFYRTQKDWENKLFGTEIEQYILDNECVFELKNKKQSSRLRIVYSGFAKIEIQIIHDGLDSPENEEIQIALTKLTQNQLTQFLESFILDFKNQVDYVKN